MSTYGWDTSSSVILISMPSAHSKPAGYVIDGVTLPYAGPRMQVSSPHQTSRSKAGQRLVAGRLHVINLNHHGMLSNVSNP
jgi:hypothetical protein